MSGADRDLTPLAPIGLGRTRSGPVREQRPVYVDLLPPCNAGCPAGENIQAWLALVKTGDHEGAWRTLTVDNPFPAIHGRVCYHPCEAACNRLELDGAISIHGVERFLGDLAIEHGWAFDPAPASTGRRVLVIGSGPSGLAAAYHLTRMGHAVTVRDSGSEPGGMMRYGIPSYRLPRVVLDAEIDRLRVLGVTFEQDHRVVDLQAEMRDGSFDAAFVAIGAHLSTRVDIPNQDASRVVDAVEFLRGASSGTQAPLTGRVAVYGGGNTAMDAARVARRLGADDTVIVYRRTREQMPAHESEAQDAEAEGIRINWLRTISSMGDDDLTVEIQELDEDGRPHGTGQFETLAGRHGHPRARPGERHRVPARHPRHRVPARHRAGRQDHPDDRGPRHLRRWRRRAQPAHRHGGHRARQAGRPLDRRVAAGPAPRGPAQAPARRLRQAQPLVLRRARAQRAGRPRPGHPGADLRRGAHRADARPRRPSRPAAACRAATASSATAAWAPAPRMPW